MKLPLMFALIALVSVGTGLTQVALAQTGTVTLRGQVVCSDCWFEAKDRKATPYGNDADMQCALRCSKAGIPQALAVWNGDQATLYILENGAFKKEGADFMAFVPKEVEITGTTRTEGDKRFLRVDALKVVSAAPAATPAPTAALGAPAPALALPDLSGQQQSLEAYRGRIVVLNFWATWCVPCRKEMPVLVALQNEYAAWGVQVIGASADTADARDAVVKFVRSSKLNFPVWTGATTDHMLAFGLGEELPGTVIIDRDGKVVARFRGMVTEAQLEKEIDALVAKQQASAKGKTAPVAKASSVPS